MALRADRRLRLCVAMATGASGLLIGPVNWYLYGDPLAFVGLIGLCSSYVLATAVLWSERPRLITAAQLGCALLASAGMGVFALGTGRGDSVAFQGWIAIPLVIGVVCLETPLVPIVSGLSLALVGSLILRADGKHVGELLSIGGGSLISGAIGLYANYLYSRSQTAELVAERERRLAGEERALFQRQREEADRLLTLGRIAAGVAHEVNNPLAFVRANVRFVDRSLADREPGSTREELAEALAEAEAGLCRIQEIVSDLGTLVRPSTGVEASCDPTASIQAAVRIAAVKAAGCVSFEIDAKSITPLAMNGSRFVQVLVNLLINAVDAITANGQAHGTVWIQLAPGQLVISDDGPGLSPGVEERIFEPFFSTKPQGKGTGLGLALCRQYLSESGFSISADGRPGGGARFIVKFG